EFGEQKAKIARAVIHTVLKTVLKLLAPIIPFITDYIYRELYNKSVHTERFPEKITLKEDYSGYTQRIMEFNESVWKLKKERGLSLNAPISVEIPEELKIFENDLKKMHKIN
ncbi:class I tRNA ligase family protein, partial [bacterium]|nr:class I tRNA ligase family protein [bacterium]